MAGLTSRYTRVDHLTLTLTLLPIVRISKLLFFEVTCTLVV